MKKFFEKHDLFKLVGIFVIIAVLLTWLVSSSYFASGTLTSTEFSRVGLFDLTTYGLLQIFYFTVVFMFVIVVGGFYKFVGSLDAYDNLTSKIAAKFKGKEKVLVALSILLFGVISGVSTDQLVLFALAPFVISILSKLKVDKITGLVATFGGDHSNTFISFCSLALKMKCYQLLFNLKILVLCDVMGKNPIDLIFGFHYPLLKLDES